MSDQLINSVRGTLLSVQVGRIRRMMMPENARVDFNHLDWESGIFKDPLSGPVAVTTAGMAGDEQADLENHGGPDNVVLAYDVGHYPEWRKRFETPDLGPGSFGENFTVQGFSDDTVCVGDIWEVGPQLVLQVTQARQPCYKLARRLRQMDVVKMVRESGWGGWYLRVLREGGAEAGMEIRLVARLHAEWPVSRAVQVMYARRQDRETARLLGQLPELSRRWKEELVE